MNPLSVDGIDISHSRLIELSRLADQAEPFYQWIIVQAQRELQVSDTLEQLIKKATKAQLEAIIARCYNAAATNEIPLLFDGIGRSYPHKQACYYFFAWLIRDAPKQRLEPLIQRIVRFTGRQRQAVEIEVLATLLYKYRDVVKSFAWDAIREIVIDRLEGSRRSLKGHEKEIIVRTALLMAIQNYFNDHKSYGIYAKIEIPDKQISIDNESFDVSANLFADNGQLERRILIPIKTRETEGGGHSHLFTRDIMSAINTIKRSDTNDFLVVMIVARNWSVREAQSIENKVDYMAVFDLNPSEFTVFTEVQQAGLNQFIRSILNGEVVPKQS